MKEYGGVTFFFCISATKTKKKVLTNMLRTTLQALSSQAFKLGHRVPWNKFWTREPHKVTYPDPRSQHPVPSVKNKLRKTRREWERYHGFGQGSASHGENREIPDWEYADGTPQTPSKTNYHWIYYKNKLLFQAIRSGAEVEKYIAQGRMPNIPGTKESREWDPQIPLFLEDVDEQGAMPPPNAVALDLSVITDLKMRPQPFAFDRRKQSLTTELLAPRVPTLTNSAKEEWVPRKVRGIPTVT